MTRTQYEHEKLRLARQRQLELLATAERNADPDYVISATGFWLERWQGDRHPTRGKKRTPCQTISSSAMSALAASSDFSLST